MSGRSEARLYVFPGSHACRTGILLVEHKGIPYRRVDVICGLHPLSVRLRGFPGNITTRRIEGRSNQSLGLANRLGTVPALRLGRERVQTNRAIARFLDRVQPEPPLFPADSEQRREVEEAERWGDEVLQMRARRIGLAAAASDGLDGVHLRGNDGRLGPLLAYSEWWRHMSVRIAQRAFAVSARRRRELLAGLPDLLDRVDGWIEAGVLNGESLNAADYMIAPSVALLCYFPDMRAEVEARPALALVDRVLPDPASAQVSAPTP